MQPNEPRQEFPQPPTSQLLPRPGRIRRFTSWYRRQSRPIQVIVGVGIIFCVIFVCSAAASGIAQSSQQALLTPTAQSQTLASGATTQPPATPTPRPAQYPPKTESDLRGLADLGDANAIHEFHSESVGLTGACPQPKKLVTVDPSITGKDLAEDLLAYFYNNQLDSPCGSIVFAYHTQAESNDDGYTAGRIDFTTTDDSGSPNVDPNATDLKYTLTLDIGGILTSQQEYEVSY